MIQISKSTITLKNIEDTVPTFKVLADWDKQVYFNIAVISTLDPDRHNYPAICRQDKWLESENIHGQGPK